MLGDGDGLVIFCFFFWVSASSWKVMSISLRGVIAVSLAGMDEALRGVGGALPKERDLLSGTGVRSVPSSGNM